MPRPSPPKTLVERLLTALKRRYHEHRLQRAHPGAEQKSLLLDLPPELRNRIYELALTSKDPIVVDEVDKTPEFTNLIRKRKITKIIIAPPALLQTCQLLRNEATSRYYGMNFFEAKALFFPGHPYSLHHWIQGLGEESRGMLKSVCLTAPVPASRFSHPTCLRMIDEFEQQLHLLGCGLEPGVLRADLIASTLTGALAVIHR